MEVIIFCVTITTLAVFSMFGLGIAIGREAGRHERVDKDSSECGVECEHADRSVHTVADMGVDRNCTSDDKGAVSVRGGDRQDIRSLGKERPRYIEEIDDESLSAILRAICKVGVCPSNDERLYLMEAASRLNDKEEEE